MKLIVTKNYEEMSEKASQIFMEAIKEKPDLVLGLATGSTPKGLYKNLIKKHKEGKIDFSQVTTFNLDEYVGLSEKDKTSYRYFMNKHLFNHVNVCSENINIPNGVAKDLEKHCKEYDDKLESAGGIDLQLLGVGQDGHIAFNEPGKHLLASTNISKLANSTIEVNSKFFKSVDNVPKTAISLGMAGIMRAKKIVLLANGKQKRHVMEKLLSENKISTEFPVSFLLLHPDVTVIVDEEAWNLDEVGNRHVRIRS